MDVQTHISKYAIVQRLGTGGMAEVFKCRLSGIGGFDKVVVIKRILPHLMEDESFVSMFLDEARIAANLTHPNIVQVFEIAQDDDGTPFIAMEFVRGPTLSQVIRAATKAGQLHLGRMVKLVAGTALGLDYAHNARGPEGAPLNIVHRDISPQNILVSLDGVPKLLDFGVAKADGRITHTQGGVLKGKVRFMAPEMIVNPDGDLDRRADIFSLGVCLYICTTGKLPFSGDNDVQIMQAIAGGVYQRPSNFVPGFPPELEKIIDWTLATKRDQRCGTCRELSDHLMAWVNANPEGTSDQEIGAWLTGLFPEMDSESWSGGAKTPSGLRAMGTPISRQLARPSGNFPSVGPGATPSGLRPPTSASGLRPPTSPSGLRMPSNPGLTLGSNSKIRTGVLPPYAPPPPPDGVLVEGEVDVNVEMTHAAMLAAPPAAASSNRPLLIGGAVAAVLLLGVGGYFVTRPAPPPPVAPVVTAPVVVAAATDTSIKPYLDEAESLLAAGKVRAAQGLAEKARGSGKLTPTEDIRLSKLEMSIKLAGWLEGARKAVDANDLAGARLLLAQVEGEEPENQAARALRDIVRAQQERLDDEKEKAQHAAKPGAPAPVVQRTPLALKSEPPGATVYVDGDPVGTTPLVGFQLRAGAHHLRVVKKGLTAWEDSVTAAGKPLALQVTLQAEVAKAPTPAPAVEEKPRLKVTTSVPAQISVDGVAAGPSPFESEGFKPGRHTIAATAEGYQPASQDVTLVAGETRTASLSLAKVEVAKAPEPAKATEPAKVAPQAPGLPRVFNARTMQDLGSALRSAEMAAVSKGGFSVAQVKNTTSLLGAELAGSLSPGAAVEIYPVGMYWFIVHGAQAGKPPQQIARELKAAHFANELADLAQ